MSEIPVLPLGVTEKKQRIPHRFIEEPMPAGTTSERREAVFAIFLKLQPRGAGIELNLTHRSVRMYVYQFQAVYGKEHKFRVYRTNRSDWAKIWRVR